MRKKNIKVAVIILLCLVAVLLIWNLTDCATLHIGSQTADISFGDSLQLRWLLLMKETQFHEYACGFSEGYAIQIGGLTYCLAQDACNSVYIKELDFYYVIYEGNHVKLHELLSKYE